MLRRQGYLEARPCGTAPPGYWRLRFRQEQTLRTVYLGNDISLVQHVEQELSRLQFVRRRQRELKRAVRSGRLALRSAKQHLAPVLFELGYHYHGDTLRKSRTTSLSP